MIMLSVSLCRHVPSFPPKPPSILEMLSFASIDILFVPYSWSQLSFGDRSFMRLTKELLMFIFSYSKRSLYLECSIR